MIVLFQALDGNPPINFSAFRLHYSCRERRLSALLPHPYNREASQFGLTMIKILIQVTLPKDFSPKDSKMSSLRVLIMYSPWTECLWNQTRADCPTSLETPFCFYKWLLLMEKITWSTSPRVQTLATLLLIHSHRRRVRSAWPVLHTNRW